VASSSPPSTAAKAYSGTFPFHCHRVRSRLGPGDRRPRSPGRGYLGSMHCALSFTLFILNLEVFHMYLSHYLHHRKAYKTARHLARRSCAFHGQNHIRAKLYTMIEQFTKWVPFSTITERVIYNNRTALLGTVPPLYF
jgi:hypothetical protein